jgi:hypothetical protein
VIYCSRFRKRPYSSPAVRSEAGRIDHNISSHQTRRYKWLRTDVFKKTLVAELRAASVGGSSVACAKTRRWLGLMA